jgi:hypothetical protein
VISVLFLLSRTCSIPSRAASVQHASFTSFYILIPGQGHLYLARQSSDKFSSKICRKSCRNTENSQNSKLSIQNSKVHDHNFPPVIQISPPIQPCHYDCMPPSVFYILVRFTTAETLFSERARTIASERKSRASVKAEEGKVEGGQTASKSKVGLLHVCVFFLRFSIHCTHN